MAANSQSSSNMSERNEIVRTNTTQAAFSGALLPVIGSGVALIAMLTIGTITIAGAIMGAMPGY